MGFNSEFKGLNTKGMAHLRIVTLEDCRRPRDCTFEQELCASAIFGYGVFNSVLSGMHCMASDVRAICG